MLNELYLVNKKYPDSGAIRVENYVRTVLSYHSGIVLGLFFVFVLNPYLNH